MYPDKNKYSTLAKIAPKYKLPRFLRIEQVYYSMFIQWNITLHDIKTIINELLIDTTKWMCLKHCNKQVKLGIKELGIQFWFIGNSKIGKTSDLFEKGASSRNGAWEVLAIFHTLIWAMATEGHQAVFNISVIHVFQTSIKKKKRTKSIKISKFISLQRCPRFWAVAKMAGFGAVHRQSADLSLG